MFYGNVPFRRFAKGKIIHDSKIRNGFDSHVMVENYLVALYAKCENMDIAHLIFHRNFKRIIVSWNGMIARYGVNGYA